MSSLSRIVLVVSSFSRPFQKFSIIFEIAATALPAESCETDASARYNGVRGEMRPWRHSRVTEDAEVEPLRRAVVNMDRTWDESVTLWIAQLKEGDGDAAGRLWKQYFERLTRVARRRMEAMPRREQDEEDVALSVFDALCRGAVAGRFEQLTTRDDLWRLLIAMTANRVVDHHRRRIRAKRGGGDVRGHSIMTNVEAELPAGFDQFASQDPSPEFLTLLDEGHRELLARLRDDTLRSIAQLRMEGYATQEIAARLQISLRSVERKLRLIREEWMAAREEL